MSRSLPDVVALDADRIAWFAASEARLGTHADIEAAVRGRRAVDLVVASDTAVHWMQAVPHSVASLRELRLVASARCAQLFGGSASDWCVAGDWRVDQPFLCAGIPRAVMSNVEQAAGKSARMRWNTAFSWALREFAQGLPDDGWACASSLSTAVAFHTADGELDSVATLRVDPVTGPEAATATVVGHMRVEAVRIAAQPPVDVTWIGAPAAGATCEAEAVLGMCAGRSGERA